MSKDIIRMLDGFLSEEPAKWAKLASDVQWRRLQLLLLREILMELKKINKAGFRSEEAGG
jgi:hypothetical protein